MQRNSFANVLLATLSTLAIAKLSAAADVLDPATARAEGDILWYDAKNLDLEGRGWTETKAYYDRLPAKAESKVRPAVWNLSQHSAGLCVRFITDAADIHARWTVMKAELAMRHMPATGVSGLDLYVKIDGAWRWLAVGEPSAQTTTARLVNGIPAAEREYLLYLPLYNGTTSLEIGIPKQSRLAKGPPRDERRRRPILFYGTSITQGGCASRPGMVHTALLGRWLDRPVINLGFSGNGRMELEVAELMAELDPAVYVIDCLPNIGADDVTARTGPLVAALRKARPTTPIVLVEDRNYTNGFLIAASRSRNETNQAALRQVFEQLRSSGVKELYYLPGADLLGDDGEGTVDASHPTDLGFVRQAEAFRKVLGPILRAAESK